MKISSRSDSINYKVADLSEFKDGSLWLNIFGFYIKKLTKFRNARKKVAVAECFGLFIQNKDKNGSVSRHVYKSRRF